MMPRPILVYLVILTSLGWAVNLAVELLGSGGDPAVNGIFAIVVGALFALGNKKPPKGNNGQSGDGTE